MNKFLDKIENYNFPVHVKKISVNYKILIFIISLCYALYLANLPVDAFKDRINYLNYSLTSEYIFYERLSRNWISLFSNEPLFLLINIFLSQFFSPESSVRILIGVPAFITAYAILRVNPKFLLLLLLLLFVPQIIKNHIVHLRQGVAISIFLIGWFTQKKYIKYFFLLLTPFIHSSFFLILLIVLSNEFLKNYTFFRRSRILIYFFIAILISLSMGFISSVLDARQQEYEFVAGETSGLGFLFWLLMLLLFLLEDKDFKRKAAISIGFLVLYLVSYFSLEVAARIFESGIVIVLLSGLYLNKIRIKVFFLLLFLYTFYTYFLQSNSLYFGWGNTG